MFICPALVSMKVASESCPVGVPRDIAKRFHRLGCELVRILPDSAESRVAVQRLMRVMDECVDLALQN